jgi:hypothetical protein
MRRNPVRLAHMASEADSDRVDLTELDVITRYSLAVRHGTAERAEVIQTLRADLAWLEGERRTTPRTRKATAARQTASRRSR